MVLFLIPALFYKRQSHIPLRVCRVKRVIVFIEETSVFIEFMSEIFFELCVLNLYLCSKLLPKLCRPAYILFYLVKKPFSFVFSKCQ